MTTSNLLLAFQFLVSPRIPPELVLKTIQHLPFSDGAMIASLRASPPLKALIDTYEHSITKGFMLKELRHASVDFPYGVFGLKWLANCVEKYDVVDAVMNELTWRENCVAVEAHNVGLVNAGLLLLYRLASTGKFRILCFYSISQFRARRVLIHSLNLNLDSHTAKLNFMQALPRDPLTAIYLALHHATLTARYHGHGWIHQRTYGRFMDANHLSLRNELEFSFAEAALSVGPAFLFDMLVNPSDPTGETTLLNFYHEHGTHDWVWPTVGGNGVAEFEPPRTQGPQREARGKERSLFTSMLERMAEMEKCGLEEVRGRVEERTDMRDHHLAHLSLGVKERIVGGWDAE
jgi:hypothetical protein